MRLPRVLFALAIVAAVVVAAVVWIGVHPPWKDRGFLEYSQAGIWADLQSIELEHRTVKNIEVPLLLKGAAGEGRFDVLGVRSTEADRPYVWIVLNTNAGVNGIYSMPHEADYTLPCAELNTLQPLVKVDGLVLQQLMRRCIRP